MTIGLTGGMGCGKSTAARMFEEAGFHRIDCDEIVRNDVLTDPAVIDAIRQRFGDEVLELRNAACGMRHDPATEPSTPPPGAAPPLPSPHSALRTPHSAFQISRPALGARVFASDTDRLWLEALVHPHVRATWKKRVAAAPTVPWVVEVPLLFEKGLEKEFDFTVCVAASSALQLERLRERGLPLALAEQRISKQLPLAQKMDLADFVLFNDGTPDFLREQVLSLVNHHLGNHQ